ncbi:MAG: hypothetical protein HeimC3_39680 [Candidatus Heimdallarchaeota archaeon LC_3]|nr:MAG: hypothetical protein HeimC3_39680 [Candidatus Heimdallarchaeota archaeon LC_3]
MIKHFGTYIRELVFEEVRRNRFSDLPSRQRCLWLITEKQLNRWRQLESFKNGNIFLVKVKGNIHIGNAKFLHAYQTKMKFFHEFAEKYWKSMETPSNDDEIILEGEIEVLRQL